MTSQDILQRAGLGPAELTGGALAVRSPIDGAEIARAEGDAPLGDAGGHRPRQERLRRLARRSGAAPGRARPSPRRGIARRQGGARRRRHARGRKDRLRGSRRSAGDDRHLRFRRRPLAPDLRPHHRLRAPGPSHDGDMASDGAVRGHFRVQFPGCGVVMERGAGARMRRSGDLEAVGEDAAQRARGDEGVRTRREDASAPKRRTGSRRSSSAGRRSARRWSPPGTCRSSRRRARPGWDRSSARKSPPGSGGPFSNSAATTR